MRVTIAKPGVYSSYGIGMPVGTIQTVDNSFGASLVYAGQATDTDSVLLAPTNKPFDISIEVPIYPIIPTAAGIQAAINAVAAAGGGVVQLPGGVIPLSASLIPANGVYLVGVEPVLNTSTGIPDTPGVTFTSGTILAPTGAFPAITWNTAVLGTPASQGAFSATGLNNIGFKNLGFQGGTYGIFAGATNNASCWWSEFENLYFIGQTQWGYNITNYQHCGWRRIFSFNCQNGQFHGIDVASASLAPGNSTYIDMYNVIPASSSANMHCRGITFITTAALAAAADNNQFKFDRIQSNRFGAAATTQAATMANTSANITVTDGTKWDIGMPVTFSATANGFTVGTIYFVVALAANVLSVSSTYGGTAITATGATAVNIINNGFPAFEMIGLAGSAMTNCVIVNLDVEGGGTCAALFQNCTGFEVHLSQVPTAAQSTVSVCGRGFVNSSLFSPQSCNTDMDGSGPARAYQFFGARNANASVGNVGAGIWYDSVSAKSGLSLGGVFNSSGVMDLTFDSATAGGFLAPRVSGIGQLTKFVNSVALALTNLNLAYINAAAAAVTTLPTVVAANAGAWLEFYNPTAGTQTINTDGTQLFNGIAARTSITLNANASVRLSASLTAAATWTWVVQGGSSAMVAGVISAPS